MPDRDAPVEPMYSNADRCDTCGRRALLDKAGADALSRGSIGDLHPFPCPTHAGWWHVWSPRIESGAAPRPLARELPVAALYSNAERCVPCGHRALLDEAGARSMVAGTAGGLDAFECAVSPGRWHVWSPAIEAPRAD